MNLAFTGVAFMRIFPQETASSGLAPESEPSNSCPVLTNTAKSAPFLWETRKTDEMFYFERVEIIVLFEVHMITMRLALETWCLTRPPPRMIIPVVLANTALLFNLRISDVHKIKLSEICKIISRLRSHHILGDSPSTMSSTSPGFL